MDGITLSTKVFDPSYLLDRFQIDGAFDILTGEIKDKILPFKWHNLTISFRGPNMKAARLVVRGSIHKFYNSFNNTGKEVNYNYFDISMFKSAINSLCSELRIETDNITVSKLEVAAVIKLDSNPSRLIKDSILLSWLHGSPSRVQSGFNGQLKEFGVNPVLRLYDATKWNNLHSDKNMNLLKIELVVKDLNHKGHGNKLSQVINNVSMYYKMLRDCLNDLLIIDSITELERHIPGTLLRLEEFKTEKKGTLTRAARQRKSRLKSSLGMKALKYGQDNKKIEVYDKLKEYTYQFLRSNRSIT